jgi:mono/diheme cytochrome c family protein
MRFGYPGISFLVLLFAHTAVPPVSGQGQVPPLPPPAAIQVQFARDIEPIFKERCEACHGAKTQSGGLRLDTRAGALAGGYTGAVIKSGDSAGSRLIQLVSGVDAQLVMPLTGPRLTAKEIGLVRAWIDQGVAWPERSTVSNEPVREGLREASGHWAFRRPIRPPVPQPPGSSWARNAIDSFVLAKLASENIQPSPEADRGTLIRRLSLDLLGLPCRRRPRKQPHSLRTAVPMRTTVLSIVCSRPRITEKNGRGIGSIRLDTAIAMGLRRMPPDHGHGVIGNG